MATGSEARAKQLILLACILGSAIVFLDGTVVSVALPSIQRHLGGGLAAEQWVTNAYLLTLGSLILIGGSLSDLFGERRIFILGAAGFGIASLLCALAPSIRALIVARALQGIAGALLAPSALAVIVATFSPEERGKAIGSWTAWAGIATVIGPPLGGELIDVASWRWVFVINVPLVIVTVVLIRAAMAPSGGKAGGRRLDVAGAVLGALGLAGPVFALIEQPRLGWSSPGVLVPLIAGVLLLVAFVAHEARSSDPMLPLGLFANRNFAIGNLETLTLYAALAAALFFLTLFLQQVAGYTPLQSGLATLPTTLVMFALSRHFGALADRQGPRRFMGAGPLIGAAGLLLFLRLGVHADYLTEVLPALLCFSLGLAMTVAPLTAAVLAGVRVDQAGIGSAVNNATARIAGLLGTSALGAVVAGHFATSLDSALAPYPLGPRARAVVESAKRLPLGRPDVQSVPPAVGRLITDAADQASVSSFHLGLGIAAGLMAVGGITAALGIANPSRVVLASTCEGGQFVAAPLDAVGCPEARGESPGRGGEAVVAIGAGPTAGS
jgi:EmrB/QacA subfamily drug resistance transporter